jgi:uncharacterized membrane protein (DUF4010 family)
MITGLAGGLVSSTAATLAFSRQSRENSGLLAAHMLAIGTLIAWTVMFARVVVISFAVYPALLGDLGVPMAIMGLASLVSVGALLWRDSRKRTTANGPHQGSADIVVSTPFSLTQAMKFALLYAVILLLVKIVGDFDHQGGLYLIAGLAGLTDVDAITLSMSQHARSGGMAQTATIAIIIATLANTAVKMGMAATIGSADYRRPMLAATALIGAAGAVAILFELFAHQAASTLRLPS